MAGARQGPLKIKLEFKVDAEAWDALRALYADTISRLEREAQVDARVLDLQMSGEIGDDMRMTAQQAYTALSSVYSESYGRPVDRAEDDLVGLRYVEELREFTPREWERVMKGDWLPVNEEGEDAPPNA